MTTLVNKGLQSAIDCTIPISKWDYLKDEVKPILHRTGLLNLAKRLAKK